MVGYRWVRVATSFDTFTTKKKLVLGTYHRAELKATVPMSGFIRVQSTETPIKTNVRASPDFDFEYRSPNGRGSMC